MSISPSLVHAVLAMDAYNRTIHNADPQSAGLFVDEDNLGDAVRLGIFPTEQALDSGFFAAAYALNGQTVISFRGTDFLGPDGAVWEDALYGWVSGVGEGSAVVAHIHRALAETKTTQA